MDKNITIELIKLEVLNCSDKENAEALQFLKRNDEHFPWKELGEYQNLIAILSAASKVLSPPENLKNEIIKKACKLKGLSEPAERPNSMVPRNETIKENFLQKNLTAKQGSDQQKIQPDKENFVSPKEPAEKLPEERAAAAKNNEVKTEAKSVFGQDFILSKISNPSMHPDISDEKPYKDPEESQELKNKITPDNKEKANFHNDLKKVEEKADDSFKVLSSPENDQLIEKETTSRNRSSELKENKAETNKKSSKRSRKSNLIIVVILIVLAIPAVLFLASSKDDSNEPTEKFDKAENLIEKVKSSKPENITGTVSSENIKAVNQDNKPVSIKSVNNVQPLPLPEPQLIEPEIDVTKDIPDNTSEHVKNITPEEKLTEQPVEKKIVEEEPQFFVAVEEMPEPIGGVGAIQKKIVYPPIAQKAGIEGKVFVTAFIDETGTVTNVKLIKGLGAGCDEEVINAVKQTKFKPGRQRGKPVKVQVTIPIAFKFQ